MRLIYSNVSLERIGPHGFRVCRGSSCLCIDTDGCSQILSTHDHHYTGGLGPSSLEPWKRFEIMGWAVTPIPAYNINRRPGGFLPHPKGCCLGYLIDVGARILVTGDTDLTPDLAKVKGVDILVLPIGGGGAMTPEEAADAVMSIKPKISIPYHYTERRQFTLFRDLAQPYTQVVLL